MAVRIIDGRRHPAGRIVLLSGASVVLRRGSSGPAVSEWQRVLNRVPAVVSARGPLAVDGQFGPATDAATRTAQRAAGVPVDGVVGSQTRAGVQALLSRPGPAPARPRSPSGGGPSGDGITDFVGEAGPVVALGLLGAAALLLNPPGSGGGRSKAGAKKGPSVRQKRRAAVKAAKDAAKTQVKKQAAAEKVKARAELVKAAKKKVRAALSGKPPDEG